MASLNRVFLIGIVASPPVGHGEISEFVLGVPMERSGRSWLERVRVVATGHLAEIAGGLRSAQAVYADGRLVHSAAGAIVQAATVVALGDPPPDPVPDGEPAGTHAPPRAHDRVGHPRRLHAGTSRERVIWVRPTRVADPGTNRRTRRRR